MKILSVLFFIAALLSGCTTHKLGRSEQPPSLAMLKALEGNWEATKADPSIKEKRTLTYRVTSGGTAVEEILFPKTPHEMVSMYTQEGDTLAMTHYCMLGNQPTLRAYSTDGKVTRFNFEGGRNLNPAKDHHIHDLTITLLDKNHIRQEWISYENGKPAEPMVFEFRRRRG